MKIGLALLLLSLSTHAFADGNALLGNCALFERFETKVAPLTHSDYLQLGQCLGAVEGVRNTMLLYRPMLPPALRVCMPAGGIANGQAIRIALKYLRDNPAALHEDSSVLLMKAFHEAFPCPLG
ncbi:Rap1a/Tai family immunity protein [Hydrogenophaga taeniospiralis]|uniref:Rap1a/Tai family immunity protein n=1 Tax=Hydrogenophaga taeniospiralis TaxID=65656 RepID=UPI001CFB5F2D|nr:Rap1a/Tai family immunity protein [Hydrogenophaga taeniospiralis]UCU95801.1 hypothetical protein KI616_08150 [Hydrogenophaga taeniospiralis]